MRRNLQDFLDEPPFGLIVAGALGLIVTVFAFVGFRNIRSGDEVNASIAATESSTAAPAAPTPDLGTPEELTPEALSPKSPTALVFVPAASDGVVCNGLLQSAGVLSGAEPGEPVTFNSSSAFQVPPGITDATGSYSVQWSCPASDVGAVWRIQAIGQNSGGRVDILLNGAGEPTESTLSVTSVRDPFPCDGEVSQVAVVIGAHSNEEITFSSPQSSSLRPGTADEDGQLKMKWSCGPDQANKTWAVTATGSRSGQAVVVNFSGAVVPGAETTSTPSTSSSTTTTYDTTAATDTTANSTTSVNSSIPSGSSNPANTPTSLDSSAKLLVHIVEDPFVCDSTSRQFAAITNFTPSEPVNFAVSPSNDPIRQGKADQNGELLLRWKCDPPDAGTEWNLTSTGTTSKKSVTFSFVGTPPTSASGITSVSDDAAGGSGDGSSLPNQLSVTVIENPFVCDGRARPVATLSKFDPKEVVTFISSDGTSYRNGTSDKDGNLAVRWQCDADEPRTWNLTAAGRSSEKKVSFSIVGSFPDRGR